MDRRKFLKESILWGGTLALAPEVLAQKNGKQQLHTSEGHTNQGIIYEPAREIPILLSTDLVVIGGGPAGVSAAIAAARQGVKVHLLERYNHLGGLWTGGLVLPVNCSHGRSKDGKLTEAMRGIGKEIIGRLEKMHMSIHEIDPIVDPEACKYVLDEMMQEAGVKVIYHCFATQAIMNGTRIKAIIIESKSGRQAILAKAFIDCSGDGDVFHWAGENFEQMKYGIGLEARLGNTDRVNKEAPGYKKINLGIKTPLPGVSWKIMWGETDQDGLDIQNLSRLQQKLRKQIWDDFLTVHNTPGYENVFLLDIASQLGVRATRILDAEYRITLEDSMTYKTFEDCIGISGGWTTIKYKGQNIGKRERPYWQIPYRSLLPKKTDNLLVAGRCFCFDRGLLEDAREIGTCLITGQAAGTAAAIALNNQTTMRDIDHTLLSKKLKEQNVWLGE